MLKTTYIRVPESNKHGSSANLCGNANPVPHEKYSKYRIQESSSRNAIEEILDSNKWS